MSIGHERVKKHGEGMNKKRLKRALTWIPDTKKARKSLAAHGLKLRQESGRLLPRDEKKENEIEHI